MVTISTDNPVLVFGGPYGNLEATKALFSEASLKGIAPENIICTGDVVAYCADPQATVDLLRKKNIAVVMGNCEEQLGLGAEDCGCGFEEGTACDVLSQQWYAFSSQHLDASSCAWMRGLPRKIILEIAGLKLAIIHGSVSEIARFVFNSSPENTLQQEIDLSECDGVIGGHCGLPFTRMVDGKLWHNPGVIGMPANDGTPRVWYSILTVLDDSLQNSHHALAYDFEGAAQRMRDAGLPIGYAECLENGLWPSLDVLPEVEKRATGKALDLGAPISYSH
jgi:predicted phosphodiesterase